MWPTPLPSEPPPGIPRLHFFLSKLNLMESERNRLHIALLALSRASSQEEGTCAGPHTVPLPSRQSALFLR